ncbi:MAG: copper amine oxidase N-terminal domain-containing protein [Clostridia bacterium]|nr:copper amine oxidase N-terminal domain-containing protein [Clostridia bacterium]
MKRFYGIGMILGIVFATCLFSLIEVVSAGFYTSQDVNYPIYIDNVVFTPNTPAQNVNGSTYLPLRAMSQALGVQIEWDQAARRVDV